MRTLINEKDIPKLHARFIVQMVKDKENLCLTTVPNPGFYIEKRIRFITIHSDDDNKGYFVQLHGLIYSDGIRSVPKFIERWNGENWDCYYRLLTADELEWLTKVLIDRNNNLIR